MTSSPRATAVFLLAAGLAAGSAAAGGFQAPEPVVRTLPNGLTVAVFQDDRLPLVQVQLLIPAGSADEPAGEPGVANLVLQLLSRGTASRSAAAFEDAVQALGGSVGGTVSRDFTTAHGAFLASDLEVGLELLADALVNPRLAEDGLVEVKDLLATAVGRTRGDPARLAAEHVWAAAFGEHPYGRPTEGSPRALRALSASQVRAFHRDRYRPDRSLLVIAGDVTPERAFKAGEDLFGNWGGATSPEAWPPPPPAPDGCRVRIVDVPGLARAELRLGTPIPARSDADYDALTVAGELLAAATDPRLRVEVSGLKQAGLFSIASTSPVDSADREVARLRAALAAAVARTPEPVALEAARRRLAGSYVLQFETRGGLIAHWMAAVRLAGNRDRLGRYPERIRSLEADTIQAALARHVSPDRLCIVAVGPAERLRPQLESLGPVEIVPAGSAGEVVELPSTASAPPTPEQRARGRDLVSRALAAHGGLTRLRGIRDSRMEGELVLAAGAAGQSGQVLQVRKDPDRFLFSLTTPLIQTVQVLDGDRGWARLGPASGPVEDLDSVGVAGLRAGYRSEIRRLLLDAADAAAEVAWRGREVRDERETDVVEVIPPGEGRRLLFLDATDHTLVAMEQNDGGRSALRLYRDLRDVDGIRWPFREERLLDGISMMSFTVTRLAFNTGVTDAEFRRPGSAPPEDTAPPARRPRPR